MKKILMIKVPTFEYPIDDGEISVLEKVTFSWTLSLAMACVSGFVKRYFTGDYELKQFDMNSAASGFNGTLYEAGLAALAAAEKTIQESEFDVIALSNQFLFSEKYIDDVIAMAKSKNPDALVVTGGAYATIFPEKSIHKNHVNFSVYGEGEHTFVHILNKIYGIEDPEFTELWPFDGYGEKFANGDVVVVPKGIFPNKLDGLPQPLWNSDDLNTLVSNNPNATMPVMASRGCPMGCSFCSTHLTWGKPVRYRPAEDVVREIMTAYNTYGFKKFSCVDDNITFKVDWFVDFCEQLSSVQPDDLEMFFSNFDMRFLTKEVLQGLKKIGVIEVTIATESGTKEGQKQISKKLNLERVRNVVKMIHEEDLFIHNCFLIGLPEETIEQMHGTVDFARELRTASMQIWPVFPFPGTKLYDQAKELGFINMDEDDYSSLKYRKGGTIESTNWDVEDVKQIAYDANIELNFLNNPLYDTERGRTFLRRRTDGVVNGIGGHVIALIVSGYLSGTYYDDPDRCEKYFQEAFALLLDDECIFTRYMHLDFPALNRFREWAQTSNPDEFETAFRDIPEKGYTNKNFNIKNASDCGVVY